MTKLMKIKSRIQADATRFGWYEVVSQHYDGTPFTLKADMKQVQLNEPITAENTAVDGFLYVEQIGEQQDKAFIVLPYPSVIYGKNVCVSTLLLSPMHVSINDFIK